MNAADDDGLTVLIGTYRAASQWCQERGVSVRSRSIIVVSMPADVDRRLPGRLVHYRARVVYLHDACDVRSLPRIEDLIRQRITEPITEGTA